MRNIVKQIRKLNFAIVAVKINFYHFHSELKRHGKCIHKNSHYASRLLIISNIPIIIQVTSIFNAIFA